MKSIINSTSNSKLDPIFIMGIMQRSGTNFLYNILKLHPDCDFRGPIWEDGLMNYAGLLIKYVISTYKQWNPNWRVEEIIGPPDLLCQCIGNGLIYFLNLQLTKKELDQTSPLKYNQESMSDLFQKRLITKTPNIKNLQYFFKLFPNTHLIIIIRDGRSVVESGVRSFSWDYEKAMRKWAKAARDILQFDQDTRNANNKYLIVRYEDLYNNIEEELRKIFVFLGLDADKYNFEAAINFPVSGSSDLRKQGGDKIHWKMKEKTKAFNPIDRWSNWERVLHERFNWIAGNYMSKFGYNKKIYYKNRLLWIVWNIVLDLKWGVNAWLLRIQYGFNIFFSRLKKIRFFKLPVE